MWQILSTLSHTVKLLFWRYVLRILAELRINVVSFSLYRGITVAFK